MGRIKIIGRQGKLRCVYCHDQLEQPETCPGCRTVFHEACRRELDTCPTVGCDGSPSGKGAPARASRRAPRPERPRPRASRLARFGPQQRLILSGALNLLALMACLIGLVALAINMGSIVESSSGSEIGKLLFGGCFVACWGIYTCGKWLLELPDVFNEVQRLLSETQPAAMRLTVEVRVEEKPDGSEARQRYVVLVPDAGFDRTIEVPLAENLITPDWLGEKNRELVHVYGTHGAGPYVVELVDGRLALLYVEPDQRWHQA